MIPIDSLKKNQIYKKPGSQVEFRFLGSFGLNTLCFRRLCDGALYYGSEVAKFQDEETYLNLEKVEKQDELRWTAVPEE